MTTDFNLPLTIAYLNSHGQTGMPINKQKQVEDFLRRKNIDILNIQEINVEEDTFSQCHFISSNYQIIRNNAINKYGTLVEKLSVQKLCQDCS